MTFLTFDTKEKLRKLETKELNKIVQFIEKIKHARKFSILETHGKPIINHHHFASEKNQKKEESAELPRAKTLNLLRKLSMPDMSSDDSVPETKEHEHVFSTKAEVEWYYIVDGEDIVYPEEFCDVLESLFRKPGHTGRHQKKTPFVDGDDTCVVDLHLMRHTNQRTGKIYPLRRKKNPLFKPKPKEKEPLKAESQGGEELPDGDSSIHTKSFFGSTFSSAVKAANTIASHPATGAAAAGASTGAKTAAKHVGRMFTRTMTWFGSKKDIETEDELKDDKESEENVTSNDASDEKEEEGEEEEEEAPEKNEDIGPDEIVESAELSKTPEPRQRGEALAAVKREPSTSDVPDVQDSIPDGPQPDIRSAAVENLD